MKTFNITVYYYGGGLSHFTGQFDSKEDAITYYNDLVGELDGFSITEL